MGLLDQLWDDTLAGPAPDSGLGKLRKHPAAFTSKESNGKSYEEGTSAPPSSEETAVRVSRRIMIVKPPGYQYGSPPISPAGYSTRPPTLFPRIIPIPKKINIGRLRENDKRSWTLDSYFSL